MSKHLRKFTVIVLCWAISYASFANPLKDFQKGEDAYNKGNYKEALVYFKKSAKGGVKAAYIKLYIFYMYGLGVKPNEQLAQQYMDMAFDNLKNKTRDEL